MISYNPKNWLRFVFNLHKADTFRKLLPFMFLMAGYAWGIAYLEMSYFDLEDNPYVKNMTLLHNLLGFALSMLLVFRTNTAYDRWWEGRKLWGSLVNNSRNLSIKLDAFLNEEDKATRVFFHQLIGRYALELKNHLQLEHTRLELDEKPHPEIPDFDRTRHLPAQIAALILSRVNELYRKGALTGDQLILLNGEVSSLLDICGACERIKNTPIPFSYSGFLKKFIFIYVATLPIGYVFSLGYLVIPVVVFIFYVLASLELIAQEIEDPFGKDSNDLPMEKMAETISRNSRELLEGQR
jgi:putative membrane protein